MITWDVRLFGKTLVTMTHEQTAQAMCDLLNSGSLHDVAGDPATYSDARAARAPSVKKATIAKQAKASNSRPNKKA